MESVSTRDVTTASIGRDTAERIRAHGSMGESVDAVIRRLLDFAEASRDAYQLFKENRDAER